MGEVEIWVVVGAWEFRQGRVGRGELRGNGMLDFGVILGVL